MAAPEAPSKLSRRSAGVLLHLSSLSGPHGIGDLGPSAHDVAAWLAAAGQAWWQMLPVGPAGAGNSPYSAPSAFAGNELFISLDGLVWDGLLERGEIEPPPFPEGRVDYELTSRFKSPLLDLAARRLLERDGLWPAFRAFQAEHSSWLEDYAWFRVLQERFKGASWSAWPGEYRRREFRRWGDAPLRELGEAAARRQALQFLFHRQWQALRRRCAELGVGLIGDVPIYAAYESADVWARPELFQLGPDGRPEAVAGVPPDYFSADGQLWGNPLYRWDAACLDWWVARLRQASERFDAARLDHFIGFHNYWAVPAGSKTAKEGRWRPGPGPALFERLRQELPGLELIAEDLGAVTPEVAALRDRFNLPGMRILQFAFGSDAQAEGFLPERYPRRCAAYTGTHDNDTCVGWFEDPGGSAAGRPPEAARREKEAARSYLGGGAEVHWEMLRALYQSPADLAVAPAQDLLGLGSGARMNRPGTEGGNWEWRLREGQLGKDAARRLRDLSASAGRAGGKS